MDRLSILFMFSWHYLVMALLCCLGIVQLSAARSGRNHLQLLRDRRATALLGVALVVTGVAFFYLAPLWTSGPWGPIVDGTATWGRAAPGSLGGARNVNETDGGLTGSWQALYFCVAWIAATVITRSVGGLRKVVPAPSRPQHPVGANEGDRR